MDGLMNEVNTVFIYMRGRKLHWFNQYQFSEPVCDTFCGDYPSLKVYYYFQKYQGFHSCLLSSIYQFLFKNLSYS